MTPRGTIESLRPGQRHVRFVLTGLAFAILGGFTLAIVLPIEAALGIGARGWVAHAQVHGHLQAVGFVSLMIVGVSFHLIPAFEGRPLAYPQLTGASLVLLAGGVLARVLGQPMANHVPFAALMAIGAWSELAGSASFAVVVLATLAPGLRRGDATPPFFIAGSLWFCVQAALGAWWVTSAAVRGSTALPAANDGVLVTLQLMGFDLLFILGVGVRSFPVFFAAGRFGFRRVAVPHALWQLGLLCVVASGLIAGVSTEYAWAPTASGLVLVGIAVTWIAARTSWRRRPSRMRPASRPLALPLQMALGWLSLAGVLSIGLGVVGAATQSVPPAFRIDAVRHIVAVGVVLTTIVAMAQLVLPEFASERFGGRQGAWRGIVLGSLLSLATMLRAGSRWWSDWLPPLGVDVAMSVAGVIAMGVMMAFAVLYVRAVRNHRALLARFAALTDQGATWTLTPIERPGQGSP